MYRAARVAKKCICDQMISPSPFSSLKSNRLLKDFSLYKIILPADWEVCNDFDGDDDYADRCLGRQSQGGGGATLMSSCPQPKPTPYTCRQCNTYIAHRCLQPKPTPYTCPQCSTYICIHCPQLPTTKSYITNLPAM